MTKKICFLIGAFCVLSLVFAGCQSTETAAETSTSEKVVKQVIKAGARQATGATIRSAF